MDTLEQVLYDLVDSLKVGLYQNRNEVIGNHELRESMIEYLTDKTTRAVYELNQFVNLSSDEVQALRSIYSKMVAEILESLAANNSLDQFIDEVTHIVVRYISVFRQFLSTIRDGGLILHSGQNDRITCAEYTPQLQLHLLGIDVEKIQEPILDIGCGEHGRLVHHLRESGYEAYGVDRSVTESPHLNQADWSELPWENGTWGTIISHMAFSNHFHHHHLRKDGQPEAYARMFMSILKSLKKGGSFYYAPGLPFIEDLLPTEEYRVTRVQDEAQKEFYSTQILRLE